MYGQFVSTQTDHITWGGEDQLIQHLVMTPAEQIEPDPVERAAHGGRAGNTI